MSELLKSRLLFKDDLSVMLEDSTIEVLSVGEWIQRDEDKITNNILQSYKLLLCVQGEMVVNCYNQEYRILPNDVVLIPPSLTYSGFCLGEKKASFLYLFFKIDSPYNDLAYCLLMRNQFYILKQYLDKAMHLQFRRLMSNSNEVKEGSYFELKYLIMKYIIAFYSHYRNNMMQIEVKQISQKHTVIKDTISYLEKHVDEKVKVQDICKTLFVSQSYLYKTFMMTYGVSPQLFILNHKLIRSLTYLQKTTLSIHEVAQKTGFSNIHHFSQAFKNKYNLSPKQFQKKYFKGGL